VASTRDEEALAASSSYFEITRDVLSRTSLGGLPLKTAPTYSNVCSIVAPPTAQGEEARGARIIVVTVPERHFGDAVDRQLATRSGTRSLSLGRLQRVGGPSGTVTFLFTDIEGSTRLWETAPGRMRAALARHDELLRAAIEPHGGYVFSTGGDGLGAAFARAGDGAAAASEAQASLRAEPWPEGVAVRVRMGLHTGEAEERDGDYFGPAVNRAARLMASGHGGQVLCSSVTAELLTDLRMVDLGEYRLRDLTAPQRVFQLGTEVFPPVRSLDAFKTNLAVQLTTFVGRQQDLKSIETALEQHRVVTLIGVGGVGKTRLALQVGAHLLAAFADGVWLIELAAVGDASLLPYVVASALGVQPREGVPVEESVREYLASRDLLLVLDNCEHLLDAVSGLVEKWARACPALRVLATSREGLGIDGEQLWPVRPLPVDTDAVELFCDRARAVLPGFVADGDTATAVGDICMQLDGIPLAIELAAARVASLGPADIAERLGERFRLLTGGPRARVERHQTLRAAIDWSWGLLDAGSAAAFDRMSVFAGGFTLGAAEAVVSGDGVEPAAVLDVLSGLVAKSLVVADAQADGTRRYVLLETLRQYGREHLDAGGTGDRWRHGHAEYFADFVARAVHGWKAGEPQRWLRRLEVELDNVRGATTWAAAAPETGDLAVRLTAPLWMMCLVRPAWGVDALADAVIATGRADGHRLLPALLSTAGRGALHRGDLDRARALTERAISVGEEDGRDAAPNAYVDNGLTYWYRGLAEEGLARTIAGEHAAKGTGDPFDLALTYASAAAFAGSIGRDDDATRYAELAFSLAEHLPGPDHRTYIETTAAFGLVQADPERALDALSRGAGSDQPIHAWALMFLVVLTARHRGEGDALLTARRAVLAALDLGLPPMLAQTLEFVASSLARFGYYEPAAVLFAAVDAAVIGEFTLPDAGWQRDLSLAGRAAVAAALGPDQADACRLQARHMTVAAVIDHTVKEIDSIIGASGTVG
jgi:predicted ATPase/class 3 adenylate cyclase